MLASFEGNNLYTAIFYIVTTLPLISVLGYFNSNIEGSSEGYIIPFCVAPAISYAYCE